MKEYLTARINQLAKRLGIPDEALSEIRDWNYENVLKKLGAKTWCERDRLSVQLETEKLATIAPGAQLVLVAQRERGSKDFYTLVQARNDGEEAKKEIGFPGGASNMWEYNGVVELEHPVITAYREFCEEVGLGLEYQPVEYLTYTCTTNHYSGYPDAYAPSMYYYINVFFEDLERYAAGKGSKEGEIMILPIKELRRYRWFPNAEEAFEALIKMFGR